MIVKMKKIQVVSLKADRELLLATLRDLGALHLVPFDPGQAVPEADIALELDGVRRVIQILSGIEPADSIPPLTARDAVAETLAIQRSQAEYDNRLSSLHRLLEQQSVWGDVTLDDLEVLKEENVLPAFYLVPGESTGQIAAEFISVIGDAGRGREIVAVVDRIGNSYVPEDAEFISFPVKDNPSIRAEAAEIEDKRERSSRRLTELAGLLPGILSLHTELEEMVQFSMAANGAMLEEDLFAIQGWVPQNLCEALPGGLREAGLDVGLRFLEPDEEESPPTLIKYPSWARPIKGLFDMLNTFPGYKEIDLAAFFMIAMPIFAAMLIGDGGYGLLFLLFGALMYKKLVARLGSEGTQFLIVIGAMTLVWGILTANFFGVTPETMARAGGFFVEGDEAATYAALQAGDGIWATVGGIMMKAPLWEDDSEATREMLIKISFLLGSIHLVLAHIRRAIALAPDQRMLADIGWATVLVAMLGVIWGMFFGGDELPVSSTVVVGMLAGGLALVLGFNSPYRNPLKRILVGFASSLLPLISTFGDTMSYIRLMAVGLASYYIAFAFNDLGATIAGVGTWAAAVPVLLIGHALNIILCVIAIFAHGVRLNMLEFSGNAGVQWAGYAYAPFARIKT